MSSPNSGLVLCAHAWQSEMGIASSTTVRSQQRAETVAALTQTTVQNLRASSSSSSARPQLLTLDAWNAHAPPREQDIHTFMCTQALNFATRGGSPLLKAEIVHLVMSIRHLQGVPITITSYTALMHRGTDELLAMLRAIMYAPDFLKPTIQAAVGASTTATATPSVTAVTPEPAAEKVASFDWGTTSSYAPPVVPTAPPMTSAVYGAPLPQA